MKIGEVSRLLGIPKATLRMYEQYGAFHGSVNAENGYHDYNVWDITFLMEFLQLRRLGFSMKDAAAMLHDSDITDIIGHERTLCAMLRADIEQKQATLRYLEEQIDQLRTAQLNIGCFWVQHIPERLACRNMNAVRAEYRMDQEETQAAGRLSALPPFAQAVIRLPSGDAASGEPESGQWYMVFDARFIRENEITGGTMARWPAHAALCTVVDAGDRGSLSASLFDPLKKSFGEKGLSPVGEAMYGTLLSRASQCGVMRRLIRLEIPIES